jgi:hypothetical protein
MVISPHQYPIKTASPQRGDGRGEKKALWNNLFIGRQESDIYHKAVVGIAGTLLPD